MKKRNTNVYQGNSELEKLLKIGLEKLYLHKMNEIEQNTILLKSEIKKDLDILNAFNELETLTKNSNFTYLSIDLNYPVGLTTIKRLWKYEKYDKTFSVGILNVLAELAGYKSWIHYLKQEGKIKPPQGNSLEYVLSTKQFFDAETDLSIGKIITLGNEYGRNVKLEYVDFLAFKILEYNGRGDKKVGEIIEARWFDVIGPNFKDHGNKYEDIIALTGELKSHEYVCSHDIDIYERLYL